jgi:undecaprenyl diphosphate synthase
MSHAVASLRRQRAELHELGVRVRWSGRAPRLRRAVVRELRATEELTRHNDTLTLYLCVNYGGRVELADAVAAIARRAATGQLRRDATCTRR